jgi:NAD(P)H dehydrogenase (quinone)
MHLWLPHPVTVLTSQPKEHSSTRMSAAHRPLVVFAHPDPNSLCAAAAQAVVRGLEAGGKTVTFVDLYAEEFRAAMSAEERLAYESPHPIVDPAVERHAELVRQCDALVLVYPTWNMGMPAILKGWVERVFVPGVAFQLDPEANKITGGLGHIRRFVGVSTYGSPQWVVRLVTDGGRRLLTRCLRVMCPTVTARTEWFGLYGLNQPDEAEIVAFLGNLERRMQRL